MRLPLFQGDTFGIRADVSAVRGCLLRIEHNESRVINLRVPILEALGNRCSKRTVNAEANRARVFKHRTFREKIVEEKARAEHPGRTRERQLRDIEGKRSNNMRCRLGQHISLQKCFAHEAEFVKFEIAEAAMNKLGTPRRSTRGEIPLFDEHHRQAATRSISRNTCAINAASNNEQVNDRWGVGQCVSHCVFSVSLFL